MFEMLSTTERFHLERLLELVGLFITISGSFFRIGTLLNLSFDLLGSSHDTFFTVFHDQLAFRNDLGKGSHRLRIQRFTWPDAQSL